MTSKNQIRRERKKRKRAEAPANPQSALTDDKREESTEKSNALMLARKYEWMNENDPMIDMYARVSARFKRPRDHGDGNPITNGHEDAQIGAPIKKKNDLGNYVAPAPSRKQLRKASKPALSELKNATTRPELIEWFDADAAEPHYLVRMKTLPNAVQVPSNWQQRSEMPQFSAKPQYELPQNIKETGIQDARKGDKLDVDYEKMQDAFFSSDAKKPGLALLPYGQLVDLKLKRAFAPSSGPSSQSGSKAASPPPVSEKLLKALGIKEHDPFPWEEAVRRLGPSPGYAHFLTKGSFETSLWGSMM